MSSPSKSPTMEPVPQSNPHPEASNSVTDNSGSRSDNSGSPSLKPLQQIPHELVDHTRQAYSTNVANIIGVSSVLQEADQYQFSDEEEELNNFNNNQKKLQDAFLSSFPPGYRFNPRDDELVQYYLQKKIMDEPLPPNKIMEVNLYRYNPETLAGKNDTYGEKEWYFFTPRDRKYRNGLRPNRAAGDGYWKATGADKPINSVNVVVGYRKALVFYRGKPPKGIKTNWIMHEYRVPDSQTTKRTKNDMNRVPDSQTTKRTKNDMRLDNWVLCRIYKKADNKNKIQTQNHEADPVDEENISMSLPDDMEMEMNDQVDNTQATESEKQYPHIAHPSLEFNMAYPNFPYRYTSYPAVPLMNSALSNNTLHYDPFQQSVALSSRDSDANMFHPQQIRTVPLSNQKHGYIVHPVEISSDSMVCKEEEESDQKCGMQFPGQKYIVQSPNSRLTKTYSCGKSVQPRDAVGSKHPSVPCLDQESIQQEYGKPLLLPPSNGLQYIEESNDEHDDLLFSDPHFTSLEAFTWSR